MRNDQELYQLFRARLPIATLPKDFADRLTKAVLEEVAQLRQEQPLTKACPDSELEDATPFNTLTIPKKIAPLPCSSKTIAIFLLLNFLLWPLMQGCTFPITGSAPQPLGATDSHTISNPLAYPAISQPVRKQLVMPHNSALYSRRYGAQSEHLPPLLPIQPQLPIVQLHPRTFVSKPRLTLIATPSTDEVLINIHGPPGVTPTIASAMTITMPYESPTATQDTGPDTPPEPTPIPPEQPLIESPTTATPTLDVLIVKPTAPATIPTLAPTPILSIFEPTATPGAAHEEPTGATPVTPTAIPTICILPWHPSEAATTNAPTVEETPPSVPIP